MFKRECPNCKKEINYKNLISFNKANIKNTSCQSCNKIGEKNPFYNKHHTENTKKYFKNLYKGISISEEHKQNIKKSFEKTPIWNKGKTGLQKCSFETKKKLSKLFSGEKNPMYGKPSPQGSGNGWSGWYNGLFFRSLKELSFLINVLERFNFEWQKGEQRKFRIKYVDKNGIKRTYHPDFIINNKFMVEIKPKSLFSSDLVKRKKEAAEEWCKKNNLKYKLIDITKKIEIDELNKLINENKVKLTDRYQNKFNMLCKKE